MQGLLIICSVLVTLRSSNVAGKSPNEMDIFFAEKTIELNGWRVHGNPIIVMVYKLGTMIKMIQI